MTAFARKVLTELPAPTNERSVEQLSAPAELREHDTNKAGGKVNVQVNPHAVGLRPLRLARRRHLRRSQHPAAVGRRRQRATYARNKQLALGTTYTPTVDVAARGALRLVEHARAARIRRRSATASALDAYGITGLPTDPRVAGGLPTQLITGFSRPRPAGDESAVAVPDGLQPEGQLHVAARAATRSRAATSSSTSRPKCRTSTRSTAATTYAGQFSRPAGVDRGQQPVQPRRLHVRRCAAATR